MYVARKKRRMLVGREGERESRMRWHHGEA